MLRCATLVLMAVRVRPFGLALALLLSAQAQAQAVPPAGLWSHQNDALVSLSSLVIVVVLALLGAGIAWYAVRTNRRLVRVLADSDRRAQREQVRSRILGLLAQDSPLPTLLYEMVRGVEAGNPEMLCSILLLDSQQQCLLTGAAPSLPDSFNAAIHGAAIGPARGSCGTAASTGERVVVQDIQTHPYWVDFRDLAAQAGLASCWSEPIRSPSGQVLGTVAIYHRWPQAPGSRTSC